MKSIGIVMGAIFVVVIFWGMLFISSSGMSEDNAMEQWMQDHTLKVNLTTTCKYDQGYLLVKEVYTGEELKERFGIEQLTKELKIPVEAEVLVEGKLRGMQEGEEKVFVTEKVTVLTSGDDPPHWWDNYTYPQWAWSKSGDIYEKEDPINLAWKNTTKDTAKSEILEEGWYDWGTWYDFYVFDPVYGWINDDNVADDPFGIFGRYHARLWQMSDGDVVANAHHDSPVPHEADELEEAEELVTGFFDEPDDTEWRVYEDSYNLDNNVTSPYSNGWCTQINYGPATWYVPDDYSQIQWAVGNATAGDTIIVRDGIYSENVDVNVDNLTIRSENGSANCIVQAGNPYDRVFAVTAGYVNISGFTVKGRDRALYLDNVDYCNIANNNCSTDKYAGIELRFSNNNTLTNNTASNSHYGHGIIIYSSSNNTLTLNTVSNNWGGIDLYDSRNNILTSNIVLNNSPFGIILGNSNNNILTNNNISNNDEEGIYLTDSNNNNLTSNIFINNGIHVYYSYQNTVEDNTVNGKSLIYLEDDSDFTIADAGQVILVNCDNITIENLNLSNASVGVELWNTDNSKIMNITANWNVYGIYLDYYSSNNILSNNTVLNNWKGINLDRYSNNNILMNNTIKSNRCYGVDLGYSNNITLTNNTFVNNGIFVGKSYQNTVEDNTVNGRPLVYLEDESDFTIVDAGQVILIGCSNITVENLNLSNTSVGIELWETNDSKITSNSASNNYWGIYFGHYSSNNILANNTASNNYEAIILASSSNNTLTSNTANSNTEAGFVLFGGLFSDLNNTLTNNIASNNSVGIRLEWADKNTLTENIASNNDCGIRLYESSNNTITKNNASGNSEHGIYIYLGDSYNNLVYLNNFINNTDNVYSSDSTNIWNSSEKVIYTYNGSTYTNYLGNYWDDYTDVDANNDGIWDHPYSILGDNNDSHPLMMPWENYFAPIENIFDTEAPANPYPSIMGNHTGTMKPNQTITVSKLYTYPCSGTGGHTESIKLYENDTLIANGSWNGYVGDWHNITMHNLTGGTPYVTLLKDHKYNYTIRTGSYPQIHHNASLLTKNGWINCTLFIDANGKKYDDWIPAIKFFLI